MNTIIKLRDRYDGQKTWAIKKYSDGHFYLNEYIRGRLYYSKWARVSRRYLESLFGGNHGYYITQIMQNEAHFLETYENRKGKVRKLYMWFDNDKEFFAMTGQQREPAYIKANHRTCRVGNMALCKDGTWKHVRGL